jgi:HPt (histidine-containing phosphotransfer) domain-containing protein
MEVDVVDVAARLGDTMSSLKERLAVLEKWQELHRDVHTLEGKALTVASDAMKGEVAKLNAVIERALDKGDYEHDQERLHDQISNLQDRRNVSSGERGGVEKVFNNPLIAAAIGALLVWLLAMHR